LKLVFLTILFSTIVTFSFADNIAIFQFSKILNNLESYKIFVNELENFKKKKFEEYKNEEQILLSKKNKIEESKILLDDDEYQRRIYNFNNEANLFEKKVTKLNNYLKINIENNEKIILNEINKIVKKIAIDKKIDIVLSEEQYFIASENIDLSELINISLNNIKLNLKLTPFE